MKTRYKISSIFAVSILISAVAHAQNLKTTESVSKQFKEGSVPGLQYGPKKAEKQQRDRPVQNTKQSFKERTFTGGIPQPKAARTFSQARLAKTSEKPKPSEAPVPAAAQTKPTPPKMPPMQGTEKTN